MTKYIIRLDDACEKMNIKLWNRTEEILDKHNIKPLVGVIPKCEDFDMEKYDSDSNFNDRLKNWYRKGRTIALHGYNHVYTTKSGGINPVNYQSEFAGVNLEKQKYKIKKGIEYFKTIGLSPKVFIAPSHTFDENTLIALRDESEIRIISDTIAYDSYSKYGFTFVPQQSGKVRKLPFKKVTFCYHPNIMKESDFHELDNFLSKYRDRFISFPLETVDRKLNFFDRIYRYLYFLRRRI